MTPHSGCPRDQDRTGSPPCAKSLRGGESKRPSGLSQFSVKSKKLKVVNTHSKLVVCGLMAAIILSLLPNPSLAVKNQQQTAKAQGPPVLVSELVQDRKPNEELSKHLRKYDLIKMDPAAAAAQIRRNGRLVVKSSVRDFDLQVTPHDMRSPDYSAQVIDSKGVAHPLPKLEVTTYKGYVKGLADAQARMSLTERGVEGAIFTRQGRYFLQPARALSKTAGADEFVFFESSDLHKHDGTCGVTLADEVAAQQGAVKPAATDVPELEASGPVNSFTPMKVVRISTDADGEYVAAYGGAPQAITQLTNILSFVEGIYESEIGLSFQIVQQNTWADASSDPYTSTSPNTRLQQFRDHWNTNFPSSGANTRALAHLFTGVDLDGNTIGIASFGVTCRNATFSYGLSQQFPLGGTGIDARAVVLTAHEIGHNFSASHTNQPTDDTPADIERPCEGTIMEANVGSGAAFCPFSRSQIAGHATSHSSCLIDTVTPSPTLQDCTVTPLVGLTANGSLGGSDCRSPSRGVEHFADRYSFSGTAGQRVSITMNATGGTIDPYVYLIGPDGYVTAQDDDSNGNVNSRIPFSPNTFTLPETGTYILEATSFGTQQTGTYNINVNSTGCTINVSATATHFPASGGNGTVNVTLSNCGGDSNYQVTVSPTSATWLTPAAAAGSGSQNINFTVQSHSNSAGRRAFIIVGRERTATGVNQTPIFNGGVKIPITQSGLNPDCVATPIAFGQTLNGNLQDSDCHSPLRGSGFVADRYTFTASSGQQVVINTDASPGNPDTFLALLGPNGVVLLTDDDSGGGTTNSRIPGGTRGLTLGLAGTYTIEVTAFTTVGRGAYSITLTSLNSVGPPPHIVLDETGPAADQAAALDSLLQVRDPFSVINPGNLFNPSDPNTRVVIFVANLSPSSPVSVNLIDNNNQSHDIAPQDVRAVPNVVDFIQVTFRLPNNLPVGTCRVKVTSNGNVSNTATFRIKS